MWFANENNRPTFVNIYIEREREREREIKCVSGEVGGVVMDGTVTISLGITVHVADLGCLVVDDGEMTVTAGEASGTLVYLSVKLTVGKASGTLVHFVLCSTCFS